MLFTLLAFIPIGVTVADSVPHGRLASGWTPDALPATTLPICTGLGLSLDGDGFLWLMADDFVHWSVIELEPLGLNTRDYTTELSSVPTGTLKIAWSEKCENGQSIAKALK